MQQFPSQLIIADACDEGESFEVLKQQIELSQAMSVSDINLLQQNQATKYLLALLVDKINVVNQAHLKLDSLKTRINIQQVNCEQERQRIQTQYTNLKKVTEANQNALTAKRTEVKCSEQQIKSLQNEIEEITNNIAIKNVRIEDLQKEMHHISQLTNPALLHSLPFNAPAQTEERVKKGDLSCKSSRT